MLFRSKGQGVGRAVIEVGSILPPVLFAFAPVVIHLGSTVGAEHKAGQGIGDAGGICPAHHPFHLLGKLPGFRVRNTAFLSAIEPIFLALSAHPVYTVVIVPMFVTCDYVTFLCQA